MPCTQVKVRAFHITVYLYDDGKKEETSHEFAKAKKVSAIKKAIFFTRLISQKKHKTHNRQNINDISVNHYY